MFIFTFFVCEAQAKRTVPPEVEPLIYNGIKIVTSAEKPDEQMESSFSTYIEALDNSTGEKLWRKKVYTIKLNPKIEKDVQWIFISKIEIENEKLIITDENEKKYLLELEQNNTQKVKSILENILKMNWYILVIIVFLIIFTILFVVKKLKTTNKFAFRLN